MSKPVDCIIIGAGLVGLAAARALARAGRSVLVLDPGPPGGEASGAAAGMLAPQIEAHAGDPMLALTLAARDRYAALVADLAAAGHPVELETTGIALVALEPARAAALREEVEAQRALGLDARWLDAAALRRHQPGIGPDAIGALYAPRDGHVDAVALCAALLADATAHGARVERIAATEILCRGDAVIGVGTAAGAREAPAVVVAAGAWSGRLGGLPAPLPIEPVRGQMAALPWPDDLPRTILFGRGAYVVPRGGEALLGSTMEQAGFEKATTAEGLAHIRRETDALLPVLRGVTARRTWSGLRPVTPDARPIIGPDPRVAGLIYATGHGRNGILLGPITGEIVCELLTRGHTRFDLSAYVPDRFPQEQLRR